MGGEPEGLGRYRRNAMLYDVLVVSMAAARNGLRPSGRRRSLSATVQDGESYRVLAIQTGHGPFDGVVEAESLASLGPSEFAPP